MLFFLLFIIHSYLLVLLSILKIIYSLKLLKFISSKNYLLFKGMNQEYLTFKTNYILYYQNNTSQIIKLSDLIILLFLYQIILPFCSKSPIFFLIFSSLEYCSIIRTQWNNLFNRTQSTPHGTDTSQNKVCQTIKRQKFNYTMTANNTFIYEGSEENKEKMNQSIKLSPEIFPHNTDYINAWRLNMNRRKLSGHSSKPSRPHTTDNNNRPKMRTANFSLFNRKAMGGQQRASKTSQQKYRNKNEIEMKKVLKKLRTIHSVDAVAEDLKRSGWNCDTELGKVLNIYSKYKELNTSSLNFDSDFEIPVPTLNKASEEEESKEESQDQINQDSLRDLRMFDKNDIVVALPLQHEIAESETRLRQKRSTCKNITKGCRRIKQKIDNIAHFQEANAGKMDPEESSYLTLLSKEHDVDISSMNIQAEHNLSKYLHGSIYKALKKMTVCEEGVKAVLSMDELSLIREEICKEEFDVNFLDNLMRNLRYFGGLNKRQRLGILRHAQFKQLKKGEKMTCSKEIEFIYIVLHGRIEVSANTGGFKKRLMDGDIFGEELFVESEFNPMGVIKYSYTEFSLRVVDNTDMLLIPKESFSTIVFQEMKDELYHKLYALKSCPLFSGVPLIELISFASKLHFSVRHFCEVINQQGKTPAFCYIIANGVCRAIYENIIKEKHGPSKYARKSQQPKPIPLLFGQQRFNCSSKFSNCDHPKKPPGFPEPREKLNFSFNNQIISEKNRRFLLSTSRMYSLNSWKRALISEAEFC